VTDAVDTTSVANYKARMPESKKPFKFESWMLGALIVPIGIAIAVTSAMKTDSVDLGGACSDRNECKKPADACMSVGDHEVCTMMCNPGCPSGFECAPIKVTLHNQAGFHDMEGRYCFKPEVVAAMHGGGK
jgi:hypothetical protein